MTDGLLPWRHKHNNSAQVDTPDLCQLCHALLNITLISAAHHPVATTHAASCKLEADQGLTVVAALICCLGSQQCPVGVVAPVGPVVGASGGCLC
jgi:hypothetical protein